MARREFLQLAKKYDSKKHNPAGMYISEKMDGSRVFWDGGVTRGLPTESVPWASVINPKTGERKTKIKPVATGLWSRYGNPIMAPDWFLNQLPQMFLDGELFAGRGQFQTLRSIVAKDVPDEVAWKEVQFAVFGTPSASQVFCQGEIKNPNFHLEVDPQGISRFLAARKEAGVMEEFIHSPGQTFQAELNLLNKTLPTEGPVYLHKHQMLAYDRETAEDQLWRYMDAVMAVDGEGVMLRDPESLWLPKRVNDLLKVKPFLDAQGIITGFVSGRKTTKGSKLLGLIGAVILDYLGKRLELSGFTDEERRFDDTVGVDGSLESYAITHPGDDMPEGAQGKHFKVGDVIEFRYRELSDDGIPKEARYFRGV